MTNSAAPGSADRAADFIRQRAPVRPRLGIVLGSGFGAVGGAVENAVEIPYREIPGFASGSAPGHAGKLILGSWHGAQVAVLSGRAHYYEGVDLSVSTFPVRVLAELGIEALLLTNAAGGIRPGFKPGDFMAISDHINLMGVNPLRGPEEPGKTRFVDMTRAYDPALLSLLHKAAEMARVTLHQGVYIAVSGPSFETPAEIRAFATLGADAVGMSTVPETIVGRQCGLRIAGLSCITNAAAGLGGSSQTITHHEVLELARERERYAIALAGAFVAEFAATP
jgi:purine-nucleoside phosphorylase